MLDVAIKYNPYKVVSTITVNGETPKQNSKLIHFLPPIYIVVQRPPDSAAALQCLKLPTE